MPRVSVDPARRDAFVAEQCLGDPALQHEVEAMLAGLDGAGQFGGARSIPRRPHRSSRPRRSA